MSSNAIGAGLDPDVERTASHITWDVVYAGPEWTLLDAALAMAKGGFRHLVVLEGDDVLGVISVRDIMRVWAHERVETPAGAASLTRHRRGTAVRTMRLGRGGLGLFLGGLAAAVGAPEPGGWAR